MVKSITKKFKKVSKIHKEKDENKKMIKPEVKIIIPKSKIKITESKLKSKFTEPESEIKFSRQEESQKDISSLKQMEKKILEKFEEKKPELKEILNIEEKKFNIPVKEPEEQTEPEQTNKKERSEHKTKNLENQDKIKDDKDQDYKARVEAILFAVGKYLDDEAIAQLCDIDKRNARKALEELKKEYDARDGALIVIQEGNSWKINVREKYLSLVRKIVSDTELSKSIMETLAVIAWKTPIYQNEVVRIRGNKCYDHIAELETAGFVTKDKKGRSYVLKTTEKFYNYFDIDQKNLHGVMSEAKMPMEQKTLDEMEKSEIKPYSRENLLQALETIETKSIVQTEEDKVAQKEFLENIHQRIDAASKKTDEVVADIPKPVHETESTEQTQSIILSDDAQNIPKPLMGTAITEKDDDIVINTDIPNGSEHHFQKPNEQPQKPKQLTKKQLEKKFKEELQQVREKSESKKQDK
jgi:segregation and condensation protein B